MSTSQQKSAVVGLGVSDQTVRNWIAIGRKKPDKGWVEGIHYVNISPDHTKKAVSAYPLESTSSILCQE
jgi:DNA-binding transcriptional regulator YiaG